MNTKPIHVLLVEDNKEDARFIQETLLGVVTPIFTFTQVDKLNLALQHLAWEKCDVVLLDLSLADAQGLETFIQAQAVAPDSPILILTGLEDEQFAISAMQQGAQDYLIKGSMETDMLVRAIRYSIERKKGEVERKRLIERTQQQSQVVQRILDTMNVGILTLNANREIVIANPVAVEFLELLTPTRVGEILKRVGDTPIEELLRPQNDPLPHEITLEGDDEGVFEVHVNSIPLGHEEEGWTLLIHDVTEVRQIQVLTEEQDRQAAMGQLASGIAHDFNNIAGSIILYCEMLLNKPEIKGKDRERLATIMHQAQRAAGLTRQILDFSSTGLLEPRRMDLVPFMDQVSKLLRRTLPESIRLSLVQKDQFHVVNADPVRLQQVFLNLAVNARDAMPQGGELRIELENIYLQQERPHGTGMLTSGNWVKISIGDDGEGMPEEVLPHIFEPFFTTKDPGDGSGLGLAQVYGIVKQHGGRIEASSAVNEGTTFQIYLPGHPGPVESLVITEEKDDSSKQKTLLVVEDDFNTRTAVSEALRANNFSVLMAVDGEEALGLLEKHRQDVELVLSDLIMPGMGGVTLYHQLKRDYPEIGMMVMTGYPIADETKEILEQGGVTWLAKPIHSRALVRAVHKVLRSEKKEVEVEVR